MIINNEILSENELDLIEKKTNLPKYQIKTSFFRFFKEFGFILTNKIDNRNNFLSAFIQYLCSC